MNQPAGTKAKMQDTSTKDKQLVQRLYDAFKRGDMETLLSGMADNIEWVTPGPPNFPLAGKRRGREGVAQFFKLLNDHEEMQEFEVQEFIAENGFVVVLGHYQSRIKSTGKTARSPFVHVYTVNNGKVTRFREFFDTANALDAYRST
jgi:ketosteroid isomerase-like protein